MALQKVSLQIKNGTAVVALRGRVYITGNTVCIEEVPADQKDAVLLDAFVLSEGDRVRRVGEGEYVVEH